MDEPCGTLGPAARLKTEDLMPEMACDNAIIALHHSRRPDIIVDLDRPRLAFFQQDQLIRPPAASYRAVSQVGDMPFAKRFLSYGGQPSVAIT